MTDDNGAVVDTQISLGERITSSATLLQEF